MWAKRRILDSLIFLCAVLLGLMVLRLAQPKIQDAFAEEAGGDYKIGRASCRERV